jgi:hypothetical protein
MSENIIRFTGATKIPEDPALTLEKAKGWEMDRCIIIGWADEDFRFGGSFSEMGEMLILLEKAKQHLLAQI